ncbi:MAG: glutathione S-transferase family protein [Sphingorhabdus sp.]
MTLQYFGHPFSSYTWKGEIALIEKGADYEFRTIDQDHAENNARLKEIWPLFKFPALVDGDRTFFESSIIIEYLDHKFSQAPRLIPDDFDSALEVRKFDRVFDNHVMNKMTEAVADKLRPEEQQNPAILKGVKVALENVYGWLDMQLDGREWATHYGFSLADCAAAPSLFYADWVHQISDKYPNLKAYRARLLTRPSVKQCVDAARPYRPFFPLGAPDRD